MPYPRARRPPCHGVAAIARHPDAACTGESTQQMQFDVLYVARSAPPSRVTITIPSDGWEACRG